MSTGITATNIAMLSYNCYVLGQKYSTTGSDTSKQYYNVSDVGSGLKSLDFTNDNGGITNVDTYSKYNFLASQTSATKNASTLFDVGTISGSAKSYALNLYSTQKLGLNTSSFNLYGVSSAAASAKNYFNYSQFYSKLSSGSSATSTYMKYLSSSSFTSGSLFTEA